MDKNCLYSNESSFFSLYIRSDNSWLYLSINKPSSLATEILLEVIYDWLPYVLELLLKRPLMSHPKHVWSHVWAIPSIVAEFLGSKKAHIQITWLPLFAFILTGTIASYNIYPQKQGLEEFWYAFQWTLPDPEINIPLKEFAACEQIFA